MRKYIFISKIILSSLLLLGCSDMENTINQNEGKSSVVQIPNEETTTTINNPTVQEVFELYSDADIFLWDSIVYLTNIDWVNELVLTEDDLLGVIKYNTSNVSEFNNSAANILPIGTEIYTTKERKDILIAKYNGELKYYYMMVEG